MDSATRTEGAVKVTAVGSVVNLALTAVKLAAGILGHSQAMIADAVHSLSDFATDIVVIVGVFAGARPKDRSHKYGHGKFETLATTIVGLALVAVGLGILWTGATAIWHFFHGVKLGEPALFPLIMAIVSIITKEVLYRYTMVMAKRLGSQAMVANAWHHRSDALSSIGAGLGIAGAIFLGEHWRILDPIAAIVVSAFVLKVGVEISRRGLNELMEASLDEETERKIFAIVSSVAGVREPHNLRTRALGNNIAVDIHVRVDRDLSVVEGHAIANLVETRLRDTFGSDMHLSVHVEPYADRGSTEKS
ncbi:MAG TPA: cation diffusion facilitator family transporter, partial [Spirochaetia bacterium]|nr:cation diffusion facilitator family transporter [Spirochaetia bacterium]